MNKTGQSLVLSLLVIASYSSLPATARAETYFKCPPGYNWQLNSGKTAVHCKRTTAPQVNNIRCPQVTVPLVKRRIGTFPSAKPGRDKCRGTITVAGVTQTTEHNPLSCPSGYRYRQNYSGNRDKCVKNGTTSIVAPTLRIQQ